MLYDAGARLGGGFDLGEAVVHPALLSLGVRRLDLLLLSHADNDHAGGAPFIVRHMPVTQVLAGQAADQDASLGAEACVPGQGWSWDGVRFEILYSPPPPAPPNEQSCVLRVVAGERAVLLPGDVGVRSEYQMLRHVLSADLLLAPHHGSRSSSSYAFIRARSEEHTSELQSRPHLVCRLLLEKKKKTTTHLSSLVPCQTKIDITITSNY